MTKYEELEEVHAEMKLKRLLWDCIEEWDTMVEQLTNVSKSGLVKVYLPYIRAQS